MQDVMTVAAWLVAQTSNVQVSLDRTLAAIAATFVLFLMGQLVVAIRWGQKMSSTVDTVMNRLDDLSKDVAEMRKALTSIAVSEERLESHALRLQDHDVRIRTLEQMQWKYEGRRAGDRGSDAYKP